jgi:hypothetical protein
MPQGFPLRPLEPVVKTYGIGVLGKLLGALAGVVRDATGPQFH